VGSPVPTVCVCRLLPVWLRSFSLPLVRCNPLVPDSLFPVFDRFFFLSICLFPVRSPALLFMKPPFPFSRFEGHFPLVPCFPPLPRHSSLFSFSGPASGSPVNGPETVKGYGKAKESSTFSPPSGLPFSSVRLSASPSGFTRKTTLLPLTVVEKFWPAGNMSPVHNYSNPRHVTLASGIAIT